MLKFSHDLRFCEVYARVKLISKSPLKERKQEKTEPSKKCSFSAISLCFLANTTPLDLTNVNPKDSLHKSYVLEPLVISLTF